MKENQSIVLSLSHVLFLTSVGSNVMGLCWGPRGCLFLSNNSQFYAWCKIYAVCLHNILACVVPVGAVPNENTFGDYSSLK